MALTPLCIQAHNLAQAVAHGKGRVCVAYKVREVRGSKIPAWHVLAKYAGAQKGVNVGCVISPTFRSPDEVGAWKTFGLHQSWGLA